MHRKTININLPYKLSIVLFIFALLTANSSVTFAQTSSLIAPSKAPQSFAINITTQLESVKSLISKRDYPAAEKIIDELLTQIDKQANTSIAADIHFMAGKLYYKQKKFQASVNQFQQAANLITGGGDNSQKFLAAIYHEIAQCFKHLKDHAQSVEYYKKALEIHNIRKDKKEIAKALKNIAMAENKQKHYLIALDHALRSLNLLATDSTSSQYAQVALLTGIIYRNIGHYEKSLNYIKSAKNIYEQKNDIRHLAEVDNQMGLIYTNLHQLDNAKDFYQQTINLPIEEVKPETRGAAFRELGVIYYHQGLLDSSVENLETALKIYQSIASYRKTTRVYLLLGRSYQEQKKQAIAIGYFEQSLALATELNQTEFQIQALNHLGEMMLKQDINLAISLLEQSLSLRPKVENKSDRIVTYHWLKEAEKERGNIQKALEYSEKKYQLAQLLQQQREELEFTKNQVILASYKLEIELNNLRENAEINSLKLVHQQNEIAMMQQLQRIADLEIKKNRFANLLLVALLSIFILIVFYVLYRYKNTRAMNKELDYLASKDPLTNCYNRRILYQRYNQSFEAEAAPQQYSVVLADIDSFKAINDNHGHSTGDKVIQGVANILLNNVKELDTVARFGGEEFCILLPNSAIEDAQAIAEKMRKEIEANDFDSLSVTCSFGVASLNKETTCNLTLIERADMALYQSKYAGKNQVTIWDRHTMESNRS